jgi:hypothetical protein
MDDDSLAPLLGEAVRSGDFRRVGDLLSDAAVLDSSSEGGRRRVAGREPIVAHLEAPGPGDVLEWDAREWPTGVAVTFEWQGASGVDRRRWYLRRSGDEITAWWSYAAAPASEPAGDAAIAPAVLERLGAVEHAPLSHTGNSGAALERLVTDDGTVLIAKRVGADADWLSRVTRDRGRTALLWEAGAFARMPPELDHGIESVQPDGDAWWIVMRDLSSTFLDDERRLTREESNRILRAAAAMHAEFTGDVPAAAAELRDRLGMASLPVAELERGGQDLLPKQLETAWDAFADVVPDDVAGEIMTAARDPGALAAAVNESCSPTLLHGDLRDDNLGLADDRIVLLDWDLATAGPAPVEFAWYLCHDAWRIDAGHTEIERDFREAEGGRVDDRAHELGMLTGLVQYGWIFGHSARVHPDPAEQRWAQEELDWWVPRTRRALEHVGGMPR